MSGTVTSYTRRKGSDHLPISTFPTVPSLHQHLQKITLRAVKQGGGLLTGMLKDKTMEESVCVVDPPTPLCRLLQPFLMQAPPTVARGHATSNLQPDFFLERLQQWSWISFTRSGTFTAVAGAVNSVGHLCGGGCCEADVQVKALSSISRPARSPSGHCTDTLGRAAGVFWRHVGLISRTVPSSQHLQICSK